MCNSDPNQPPVVQLPPSPVMAYPPAPVEGDNQSPYASPPPLGYPGKDDHVYPKGSCLKVETKSRGLMDPVWQCCVAVFCCCTIVYACCMLSQDADDL